MDPYVVLGVPADADDAAIRRRYLELIKQYTPETHADRFAAIRNAYEQLKDLETRVAERLFKATSDTVEDIIEDLECRSTRRRLSLTDLLAATGTR